MKLISPCPLEQSNEPLAPPVLMMYFFPALTNAWTFVASCAGVMPAQDSASQVPVAKDQTSVEFGMALVTGCTVPVTAERCNPVLKSALSVTSLYAAKITLPAGGGVGVGVGLGFGVGLGVGVGVPLVHATPVNHGSPEPAGPAWPATVGS